MNKLKIIIKGAQGSGKSTTAQVIAKKMSDLGAGVTLRDGEDIQVFPTVRPPVMEIVIKTKLTS